MTIKDVQLMSRQGCSSEHKSPHREYCNNCEICEWAGDRSTCFHRKKNDGGCDIVTLISNKWTPWPVLFSTGCGEEP
jgi:hypothetical protein